MLKKLSVSLHEHFTTLLTILLSLILASLLIKLTAIYFPFHLREFFGALHLSWNKVAYLLVLTVVPPFAWFCWHFLFRHLHPSRRLTQIHFTLSGLSLLGLAYFVSRMDLKLFYFWTPDKLITYTHWKTHLLAGFFLTLTLLSYRRGTPISRFLSLHLSKIILGVIVVISLYLANFAILNDTHRYNANALNLSVVMHPVIQVAYGKAVLIDMKTQYGLYAQLLEPIWPFLGGISVWSFSLIMASLLFASLLSIGIVLLKSVHPILALVGFVATIFFHYFAGTLWPHELYFQYYPVRTIVPTITLALSCFYFRAPTRLKLIGMLAFLSLGIIWNLDVGLFALGAFVLAASYQQLFAQHKVGGHLRQLLWLWFQSVLVFAIIFGGFIAYLRLRYHIWPDIAEFVSAQKLFLSGSVLAVNRLWTIVTGIYLVGLVTGIKNLVLRRPSVNSSLIILLTFLGAGIFTYSLNNPHDSVLTNCGYPAIILLVILVHDALVEWGDSHAAGRWSSVINYPWTLLSLIVITLLGASFFANLRRSLIIRDAVTIQDLQKPRPGNLEAAWDTKGATYSAVAYVTIGDLALDSTLTPVWIHKANMAARYALPGGAIRDDLLVLSNWDYLLYLHAHAKTPLISVNFRHLYLANEWQLLFDQIKSRQNRYILVDNEWGLFQGELKNHPNDYIATLTSLISTHYHPVETELVGDSWYLDRWYPSEMVMYERN